MEVFVHLTEENSGSSRHRRSLWARSPADDGDGQRCSNRNKTAAAVNKPTAAGADRVRGKGGAMDGLLSKEGKDGIDRCGLEKQRDSESREERWQGDGVRVVLAGAAVARRRTSGD